MAELTRGLDDTDGIVTQPRPTTQGLIQVERLAYAELADRDAELAHGQRALHQRASRGHDDQFLSRGRSTAGKQRRKNAQPADGHLGGPGSTLVEEGQRLRETPHILRGRGPIAQGGSQRPGALHRPGDDQRGAIQVAGERCQESRTRGPEQAQWGWRSSALQVPPHSAVGFQRLKRSQQSRDVHGSSLPVPPVHGRFDSLAQPRLDRAQCSLQRLL